MGKLTTAGKNAALDALTLSHAAAYEGDPEGAGTELDVQAITFGDAAAGVRAATSQPEFDIAIGETVNFIAIKDGAAGSIMSVDAVTAEGPYGAAGTYTLTSYTITASD